MNNPVERNERTIVLVGKVGHGKTYILNKICGTAYRSDWCAESCTKNLQRGRTHRHGIVVIDTPGFFSSDQTESHVARQKEALENHVLSGIYVVVKYGRSDDLAGTINKVLNFVGDEGIRIILTHVDSVESAGSVQESKAILSELMDIKVENMLAVGKDTGSGVIEEFIVSTMNEPRTLQVTELQVASVADLSVGARKFNKTIDELTARICLASQASQQLLASYRNLECNVVVGSILEATMKMVQQVKISLDEEVKELTLEQRNVFRKDWQKSVVNPLSAFEKEATKLGRIQNGRFFGLVVSFAEDTEVHQWHLTYWMDNCEIRDPSQVMDRLCLIRDANAIHFVSSNKRRRKQKKKDNRIKRNRITTDEHVAEVRVARTSTLEECETTTNAPASGQTRGSLGCANSEDERELAPILSSGVREEKSRLEMLQHFLWILPLACCCFVYYKRSDHEEQNESETD